MRFKVSGGKPSMGKVSGASGVRIKGQSGSGMAAVGGGSGGVGKSLAAAAGGRAHRGHPRGLINKNPRVR